VGGLVSGPGGPDHRERRRDTGRACRLDVAAAAASAAAAVDGLGGGWPALRLAGRAWGAG
jgi:hypothetical protein